MTVTYEYDLGMIKTNHLAKYPGYCPHTHTHTHAHTQRNDFSTQPLKSHLHRIFLFTYFKWLLKKLAAGISNKLTVHFDRQHQPKRREE